jgi:hypothetical protein
MIELRIPLVLEGFAKNASQIAESMMKSFRTTTVAGSVEKPNAVAKAIDDGFKNLAGKIGILAAFWQAFDMFLRPIMGLFKILMVLLLMPLMPLLKNMLSSMTSDMKKVADAQKAGGGTGFGGFIAGVGALSTTASIWGMVGILIAGAFVMNLASSAASIAMNKLVQGAFDKVNFSALGSSLGKLFAGLWLLKVGFDIVETLGGDKVSNLSDILWASLQVGASVGIIAGAKFGWWAALLVGVVLAADSMRKDPTWLRNTLAEALSWGLQIGNAISLGALYILSKAPLIKNLPGISDIGKDFEKKGFWGVYNDTTQQMLDDLVNSWAIQQESIASISKEYSSMSSSATLACMEVKSALMSIPNRIPVTVDITTNYNGTVSSSGGGSGLNFGSGSTYGGGSTYYGGAKSKTPGVWNA